MTGKVHPWICPTCGHFIVRFDRVECQSCDGHPAMIPYTGSEQAAAIRDATRRDRR